MKLVDGTGEQDVFLLLTLEEEEALAQWVMDLLAKTWFDENSGAFYKLVKRLYWAKCAGGKDLNLKVYEALLDFVEKENSATEASDMSPDIKAKWLIPESALVFDSKDDGKARELPLVSATGATYTKREQIRIYQQETRSIWRGIWKRHKALQGSHEGFLVFPGDDPGQGHREVQQDKERRFWSEVERRRTEWDVSRKEAERLVADYMPRGDMSPSDRSEIEPPKSLVDSMEFEPSDEIDDESDFEYFFPETNPESDHF